MTTATQRATAVGVFNSHASAQRAVRELRQAGFAEGEIGVASRNSDAIAGTPVTNDRVDQAAAGGTAGLLTGASVGTLWGLGIAAGLLPAIGPVLAGGTLAAIIASAGAGAATAGVVGTLIGLGISEDEATQYESEIKAGRTIVTVKAPQNRYTQALELMNQAGADQTR